MSEFNYRDLIIFIVPILIFGLYLFIYKPGILTAASFNQLHQIATGQFTASVPIFHTFLEIISLRIIKRLGVICLLQILIFSAIWMLICKYHRDDLTGNSDTFALQFIITLIVCLIPINAVYSVTLSSNVLFSYSILFLCFLIKIIVDRNGQIDTRLSVLTAVTLAIMSGLNNYGMIIAVISLIIIAYYLFKKNTSEHDMLMFLSIAILGILLVGSLNVVFDVQSDDLNIHMNDAFEDGVDVQSARNMFFSASNEEPVKGFENSASTNLGKSNYNIVDSYVNLFRENFILDGLFNNPILYMILSIALLGLTFMIIQNEEIFLVFVPVLSNNLVMSIAGVNNFYCNLLLFYFTLIIIIGLLFKFGIKREDIASSITKSKKSITTNKVISERNTQEYEPKRHDYEKDYSYIESEIENLTLDDINGLLNETPNEHTSQKTNQRSESEEPDLTQNEHVPQKTNPRSESEEPDLIDEILKEMEMDKK